MSPLFEALSELDARAVTLLIAGLSMIASFYICTNVVNQHLLSWTKPVEQTSIIFIIMMVPLFAIDSYVGLVEMPSLKFYDTILSSVKECYEAFVIHNFLTLMFSYVGVSPGKKNPVPDSVKGRILHHTFPVTLFQPHEVKIDKHTITLLTNFTKQFVVIRPLFSVILCILELLEVDKAPWTWLITLIFNISVFFAMYALLLFYHGFDKELASHNPLAKFMCIKGVIFFSFWQGMIVKGLGYVGVIKRYHFPYSVNQVEEAIQNFLICVEMLGFAFLFQSAFSSTEYNYSKQVKENVRKKQERMLKHYGLTEQGDIGGKSVKQE